jgi:hypothetical protein
MLAPIHAASATFIYRIEAASLLPRNTYGNLLSFHPYYEVAFFKRHKNLLYYFKIGNNNIIYRY